MRRTEVKELYVNELFSIVTTKVSYVIIVCKDKPKFKNHSPQINSKLFSVAVLTPPIATAFALS